MECNAILFASNRWRGSRKPLSSDVRSDWMIKEWEFLRLWREEQRRLLSDWLIILLVPRFLKRARQ